jgi:hypothetical protein
VCHEMCPVGFLSWDLVQLLKLPVVNIVSLVELDEEFLRMTTDSTELTFVRCPSCRSLVPAVSTRCRMCGTGLQGSGAGETAEDRRSARVRQRTMTVSGDDAQMVRDEIAASVLQQSSAAELAEPQTEVPLAVEPAPVFEAAPVAVASAPQELEPVAAPLQEEVVALVESPEAAVVEESPPVVAAASPEPDKQESASQASVDEHAVDVAPEEPAVLAVEPVVPPVEAQPTPPVVPESPEEQSKPELGLESDQKESPVDAAPPVTASTEVAAEVPASVSSPVQQTAPSETPTPSSPESVTPQQAEPRKGGFSLGGQFGKRQGLSFARPKSEAVAASPKAESPAQAASQPKQETAMQDSRKEGAQDAQGAAGAPRESGSQHRAGGHVGGEQQQPAPRSQGEATVSGQQDRPPQPQQQKPRPDFGMNRNQGQNNGPQQASQSPGQDRSGERRENRPNQNGAQQQMTGGGRPQQGSGHSQHQSPRDNQPHAQRDREPAKAAPVARAPVGTRPSVNLTGRLFGWLVTYADSEGSAIELREGKIMVTGSSLKDTDLVISDRSISTPHAMITISPGSGFKIQDLISERGLWIRRRHEETYRREEEGIEVFHGDWIRLGDVEFMVALIANVGEK